MDTRASKQMCPEPTAQALAVEMSTIRRTLSRRRRVRLYSPRLRVRLLRKGTSLRVILLPLLSILLVCSPSLVIARAHHVIARRSLRALQSSEAPTAAVEPPSLGPTPEMASSASPTSLSSTSMPTLATVPTATPTVPQPTIAPTPVMFDKKRFSQSFGVTNTTFFTEDQKTAIELLFEGYTPLFINASNETDLVSTDSIFLAQRFILPEVNISTTVECIVDYSMEYKSTIVNVTGYTDKFIAYVNNNLGMVTSDLQDLGLGITQTMQTQFVQVETTGPTATAVPSLTPPTISPSPTIAPPTIQTSEPTSATFPPTIGPFDPTETETSRRVPLPIIVPVTVLSGMALLIALVLLTKTNRRQRMAQSTKRKRNRSFVNASSNGNISGEGVFLQEGKQNPSAAVVSQETSYRSQDNLSLVSDGDSGESLESGKYSVDETKNLQDEFDQYKDQNLEDLRANVEDNLSGFEGIMSAAVTKALMGDEDATMDTNELLWGCQSDPSGPEVEASALVEVSDWLKRNESAPVERRRVFMQEILNKMVASVRYGVIEAHDASRTIHESAALLGLQLANELPMTTVIISGMRKTVEASEIVSALSEFGDIDNAAVASGRRGFGIVRFRHPKSVERAMRRYRHAEIVVQDVAVQMKVLMPSGEVLSRA